MLLCDLGHTFDFDSARMFSTTIFDTYISYHKDTYMDYIYGTDYYMYFYIIVVSLLTAILNS